MVSDGTRVLLVEDNPDYAALIRRWLVQRAPRFVIDGVGMFAEAHSRVTGGGIDLVLLDLSLPDSHGLSTLERMRAAAPDVPIVVLTGRADDESGPLALKAGAEDYLLKDDVDGAVLVRSMRYALERFRLRAELQAANESLKRLVSVDPLTGASNRRGLEAALAAELARSRRGGGPLSACLIDCDSFKRINDTLGHAAGDVVLKQVADRLRESVRPADHVARIGGDEFVVLMPDTREKEALQAAERVRLAVSGIPLRASAGLHRLTVSLGVALVPPGCSTIEELLGATGHVLRLAKRAGKNRVGGGGPQAPAHEIAGKLRLASSYRAVRQPIRELAQGRVVAHELLARGPAGPFELPRDFFRVALDQNLLAMVDLHCLRACIETARAQSGGDVHLNLFPSTLLEMPVSALLEGLRGLGAGTRACVEISDEQLIGEPGVLSGPVRELRAAGVRIALDDVGFGRSSLESLILLEPDYLKIDQRLVQDVARDPAARRAVEKLVRVGRSLECEVVAVGVQTRAVLDAVRAAGVGYAQGFLWGEPH